MSDLHKKLSHAFVQITSYIEEGNQAKAFEMFERIVNAEAKQDAWTQHMDVSINNAWYIVSLENLIESIINAECDVYNTSCSDVIDILRRDYIALQEKTK